MKYASIDTGTNTLRLLIAEPGGPGALKPLIYKRAITRLGGGFDPGRGMAPDSMERSIRALTDFAAIIKSEGVQRVRAVATSVVRRAVNRQDFLQEVKRRAGITIEVIDGMEEARLTLRGVRSVISGAAHRSLVMDIGGGSTEFIATEDGRSQGAWSLEMGVVRLTEKYLLHDPPEAAELRGMEEEISSVIRSLKDRMREAGPDPALYGEARGADFIGTAGTITTLAALDLGLDEYDRVQINNHTLTRRKVEHFYKYLSALTIREKSEIPALEKGREDLIIPGAAITLSVMDAFGYSEVKVSDAGLLEGIIIEMIEKTEV